MKQGKNFIKTNIKTKAIIIFIILVLFCIFGISACGRKNLPTNSAVAVSEENNTVNTNSKNNINSNIPLFDINSPITNINSANPSYPAPNPEPKPAQTPNPNVSPSFPDNSYYDVHYFQGLNYGNGYYKIESVSYKDTAKLSEIWTNRIITNFYIEGSGSKLMFKPNGDIYWEKQPNKILKKFEGGTIVMYRGGVFCTGDYNTTYTVGGVYTYAMSRDEANKLGNAAVNKMFNFRPQYDNGGKKGRIEILVMNAGYFWNGGTGISGMTKLFPSNYEWLLLAINSEAFITNNTEPIKFAGFQAYSQRADDRLSRYLYLDDTIATPEQNMKSLQNTWNFYDGTVVNLN
ncbi:hypothetical protein [Brachyspira sp.]|uniref:hypothetical protein n=1 Tax=Brachyspira sp. TaxID=1977261 RepID=UPI003D7CBE97